MTQKVIHIHEAYNLSLRDHEVIHEKESLSDIKKMLHMLRECILVKDFNLHHFTWEESFYSRVKTTFIVKWFNWNNHKY